MTAPRDDLETLLRSAPTDERSAATALQAALDRAATEGLVDVAWTTVDTPLGPLTLAATEVGLVRVGVGVAEGVMDDDAPNDSVAVALVDRQRLRPPA